MICPICKGGKTLLKKVQGKGCYEVVLGICDRCHGTGEIEMTNEEWFCGLPTTKKSKFMAILVTEAIKEHNEHGVTRCEAVIWWDEWLKQPHTIKE